MTAVEHPHISQAVPVRGRLVAAAAFALPPLVLLAVGLGFALRGGGVAPEQWQPAVIGVAASLFVLAAVGAVPHVHRGALPLLAGLTALLTWSAASMVWSVSREATFEHVLRLALLAAAATVGLVFGARPRAALALAAGLAASGAGAATVIEAKFLAGDTEMFIGSRLSWPINYANADAALVWLPVPALLAFAAAQPLRPLMRGFFALLSALAIAVGLTAESRGAAIALTGALIASVAIARDRARYSMTLLAILAPVAALAPRMVGGDASTSAALVREHGQAALLAAAVAAVVVCALSMLDRRRRFPFGRRSGPVALALWALALVVVVGGFVTANGRPDTWISDRWKEFSTVGSTAAPPNDASHFGTGVSNRYDYWRVSWDAFTDNPVEGVGAGAFSVPWFRLRSIDENVTDAHSWEAGALAEIGLVGLLLTAAVLLFPLARVRRARAGRGAWPIAAVALGGAGVYFVLHASLDWLFRIPAIAIPGFVVLGALASGGEEGGRVFGGVGQRVVLAIAAIVVVALATPAYLSTARVADAESEAATSTPRALADLDDARRLNPYATEPLLVRSLILKLEARPRAALAAAEEAADRGPQNWSAWLFLADARRLAGDRAGSRAALDRAEALNPRAVRRMGLRR